jgi:exonuclease III
MKIVTWNCNGAFRKKLKEIDSLGADLLVIQECEDPLHSTAKHYREWAGNYLWVGTNKSKGMGVFPKNGNNVVSLNWHGQFSIGGFKHNHDALTWVTDELKLFLPFKLNNKYTILGVWTKGSDSEVFGYIGQFWKSGEVRVLTPGIRGAEG